MPDESEDDAQEKTEEPGERRLKQAREEGQVPRSKDMTAAVVILVLSLLFTALSHWFTEPLLQFSQNCLQFQWTEATDPGHMLALMSSARSLLLSLLVTLTLIVLLSATAGAWLMGGVIFSGKLVRPKWQRMNPIKGLRRFLSSKALMELVKALLKTGLLLSCLWLFIRYCSASLQSLSGNDVWTALPQGFTLLGHALLMFAIALLFTGLIDMPFQWHHHRKQLMQTHQQARETHKEEEGKPEVRRHIRRMQREVATRRMMAEVPRADLVITNPVHYAVAIRYRESESRAPVVLASGVDEMAKTIISVARHHHRTVVLYPVLARALYHTVKPGETIPADLYLAVAKILAYVYQLKRYRAGEREDHPELPVIDLPEHYRRQKTTSTSHVPG